MPKVNREALHERYFSNFVAFSREYLSRHFGDGAVRAVLFVDNAQTAEFEYQIKHGLILPRGAGTLSLDMARHAQASLPEARIVGGDVKSFPATTFCLTTLLSSAFPRDPDTGISKRTTAGIKIMHDLEDFAEFPLPLQQHVAFGGLGVTLMKDVRRLLCPAADDQQAVKLASGYFISIFE
jgi:hypothetical protein